MKYDHNHALLETQIEACKLIAKGKVRDIYDLGDTLLFVTTDRISAFDVVMPNGIPDKGRVLTQTALFWFERFSWMKNHIVTADVKEFPEILQPYAKDLAGRAMIVKKASPFAVECIVRGYLVGSGWKDYQQTGSVCGIQMRAGYQNCEKLDTPIFTPSTKAEIGLHDENISFERACEIVGTETANALKDYSLRIYSEARDYAATKGIILADTKFEFGMYDGEIILIDEVLTPDSSRFWPMDQYQVGSNPPSYDKQFVRDWLEEVNFNKQPPAPMLPDDVVAKTREKYIAAYEALSGKKLITE